MPLLFALYIETICISVAHSKFVNGFKLQSVEVELLAYANDLAGFCVDMNSISEVVFETKTCRDAAGASELEREL